MDKWEAIDGYHLFRRLRPRNEKHEAEPSRNNSFDADKREEGIITCSSYIVLKNANPEGSAGRTSRMKA